jgi:hypothetical protein
MANHTFCQKDGDSGGIAIGAKYRKWITLGASASVLNVMHRALARVPLVLRVTLGTFYISTY